MNGRDFLHIKIDTVRKVALIRGWDAKRLAIESGHRPLWSASGKGWCVDAKYVPDVQAVAELEHRIVQIREVGEAS